MFNVSPEKFMLILVIALAVLGPERIPKLARSLSRARNEIRKLTSGLDPETLQVIRNPRGVLLDALAEPRRAVAEVISAPQRVVTDAIGAPQRVVTDAIGAPQRAVTDAVAEPRLALAEAISTFKFTAAPTPTSAAAGDTANPPASDRPGSAPAWTPDDPALN